MLRWFVSDKDVEAAHRGVLINEHLIETHPEKVSSAILDEDASSITPSLQKYFTKERWLILSSIVNIKSKLKLWICPICNK